MRDDTVIGTMTEIGRLVGTRIRSEASEMRVDEVIVIVIVIVIVTMVVAVVVVEVVGGLHGLEVGDPRVPRQMNGTFQSLNVPKA
jgi:hypothetical protein